MLRRLQLLLSLWLLAALAGCNGRNACAVPESAGPLASPVAAAQLPGALSALLPAPPVPRQTSGGEVLSLSGGSFDTGLLMLRVASEHNEAVFSPALDAQPPPQLAAGVYSFNLGDYNGPSELHFDWGTPGPPADSYWLALARPASQRWEWFTQPAGHTLTLAGFDNYRYPDGSLLCAVVVTGTAQQRLYGLRIGPPPEPPGNLPLETITLPPGFSISVYAYPVPNARAMSWSDSGVLYVGSRSAGNVYACRDLNGDRVAETVQAIASGLAEPVGVDLHDGDLYVSAISKVVRLDDIDSQLDNPPLPVDAVTDLPTEEHHGWKFIRFGPDGKLYVPIGAPCNICDSGDFASPVHGSIPYASLLRFNADGTGLEVVARGIRNTVGFDWQPGTGELWFTDNGRDELGDDVPQDELDRIASGAGTGANAPHYGYPYFHAASIPDPDFSPGHSADDYLEPEQILGPHVASLGMRFYRGSMFPAEYRGQVFIAEHGSWNRSEPLGARISLAPGTAGSDPGYTIFAAGWQYPNGSRWGRPADVLELPDGSLLVSDDEAGAVYRIAYQAAH
jgi:glucose/arabinose dehydrogenase